MVLLEAAALYAGLNILLLLVLGYLVTGARRTHKISLGDGGNPEVRRAIRAHANAAEYIPAALVGIVVLALLEPATPPWLLHASGIILTSGRLTHGLALSASDLNWGRMLGMILTFTAYALIGGGLLYVGLSQSL